MVAVEHGIDVGRVHSAGDGVAVEVLHGLARLKGVVAGKAVGLARERQTEAGGVQVVAHRNLDVKCPQEHVTGSKTLVGHPAKGARVASRQANCGAFISVGKRCRGVVHSGCTAHRDAVSVVGSSPVITQGTVGQRVVPHVVTMVGGLQFVVLKVVVQCVGDSDHRRYHAHAVMALPLAVLGSYRVTHGTAREVVDTAALRTHGRTGRQLENGSQRTHVGIATHGKGDDAVGREHGLHRVGSLKEELRGIIDMERCRLDVGLTIIRLFTEA